VIHVDPAQGLIHVHAPQNTRDVPFLNGVGTAARSEGPDADGGIGTREAVYTTSVNDVIVVLHAIAAPDDAPGLAEMESLIASYQGEQRKPPTPSGRAAR
jgi:hypothetical protein